MTKICKNKSSSLKETERQANDNNLKSNVQLTNGSLFYLNSVNNTLTARPNSKSGASIETITSMTIFCCFPAFKQGISTTRVLIPCKSETILQLVSVVVSKSISTKNLLFKETV